MVWQYLLTAPLDGKPPGWHPYTPTASAMLDIISHTIHTYNARNTTHTVKSGYYTYAVNLVALTQRNITTGTVRQIRRYDPRKRLKTEHGGADLQLAQLFDGAHGHFWEGLLTPVLEALPYAEEYIGTSRSSSIVPVRELTFQAIKPLPPEKWRVIVFGQSPYPRLESATGIAMFNAAVDDWQSKKFGTASSMRNIIKAAAISKYGVKKYITAGELRKKLEEWKSVTPPQWFQSMLSQGVLFMNAALTVDFEKKDTAKHAMFWLPVVQKVIETILSAKMCLEGNSKTLFLWWGQEALKMKRRLQCIFQNYENCHLVVKNVEHITWYNPAAQGDKFCDDPPHFTKVNEYIEKQGGEKIDWLPDEEWLKGPGASSGVFGQFITNTQKLHSLYLERLQAGLDAEKLSPITGVSKVELKTVIEACVPIGMDSQAEFALHSVKNMSAEDLTAHEKGALYLYTGTYLYARLNKALRDPNRKIVKPYYSYLLLFLNAHSKLPPVKKGTTLYRGIDKDLTKAYKQGAVITWWSVSSCSSEISVVESFSGYSGTLFYVQADSAVSIKNLSPFSQEEEFVLAPGTKLKVTKVEKTGEQAKVYLEEVVGERLVN